MFVKILYRFGHFLRRERVGPQLSYWYWIPTEPSTVPGHGTHSVEIGESEDLFNGRGRER